MKLSMYILDAWFQERQIARVANIRRGQPCLAGIRFCPAPEGANYAYLCEAAKIDPSFRLPEATALANGADYIILPELTKEQAADLVMEAFEYYNSWEASLQQKITAEASLQDLLDLAHLVFERPMHICNTRGWVYAITDSYGEYVHPHWKKYLSNDTSYELNGDISAEMKNRPVPGKISPAISYSQAYGGMVLWADILIEGNRIGTVMAYENNHPFTKKDIHLMQVFQKAVIAFCLANPNLLRSRSALAEYFQDMLSQNPLDGYNLRHILSLAGWKAEDLYIVLCAQPRNAHRGDAVSHLCNDLEDSLAGIQAFPYGNIAVAIIHYGQYQNLSSLVSALSRQIPRRIFVWGLSHEFSGLGSFLDYYRQALFAMNHALLLFQPYCTMRNAAIRCLREGLMEDSWLKTVFHPDFLTLIQYDMQNNTQYTSSLYWFLFYSGNYTDAANQLNLHRNTLIYRINRVQEMLHFDFSSIGEKELFLLSYLLYPYESGPKSR